jgi:hypothetical protein
VSKPIGSWGWSGGHDGMRASWEFSQDTKVNTPTINALGSFSYQRESGHPFNIPAERQPHRAMSPITVLGHWDLFFRLKERVPPTGPPTLLPAASGLPSQDQPGLTLLCISSKPAVGCRVVCCWYSNTWSLYDCSLLPLWWLMIGQQQATLYSCEKH